MLNTSNNTFQNSHGSSHTWDEETEDLKICSVDNELSYEKQTLAVCRVRLLDCGLKRPGQTAFLFSSRAGCLAMLAVVAALATRQDT